MAPSQYVGTVVIAGPPAGGKSTQCKMLLERYGLTHVSAGDLLRARQNLIPDLSKYMQNGLLVPDDLVCSIVKERLMEKDCRDKGVLLDGFPRTRRQAVVLKELGVEVSHFILLQVPDEVVVGRVSGRRVDPVSGEVYHIESNPPKKQEVIDRLIVREDDTEEKMVQRLKMYHANIKAIGSFYSKELRYVAANMHPDAVFDQVRRYVEGDMYWGCMINHSATVRSYETSGAFDIGGSLDMISVSRYFDHMSWLMRTRGVLADAQVDDTRFVVRAHCSEITEILVPGLKLSLRAWIKSVGKSSVTLGCVALARYSDLIDALRFTNRFVDGTYYNVAFSEAVQKSKIYSDKDNQGKQQDGYIEIARGATTLVALNVETGKPTPIPFRKRLRNLINYGGQLQKIISSVVNKETDESAKRFMSLVDISGTNVSMEKPPLDSFEAEWLVQPKDVSVDGTVSTATCVGYLETSRFAATTESAYSSLKDKKMRQIRHFSGLRASSVGAQHQVREASKPHSVWMETFASVRIGDKVKMKTWILRKPSGVFMDATRLGHRCIGFHLYNSAMNDTLVLRGCQILKSPEYGSKL